MNCRRRATGRTSSSANRAQCVGSASDDKLGRSVDGAKMSTRDTLLGERVERHVRSLARNQLMSRARLGSTATIFEVVRPPVAAVAH